MKTELERALHGVEGWLDLVEASALYDVARRTAERDPAATIVEIGSWKGRSAIALAMGLRDGGGKGPVFAIDPYTGDKDRPVRGADPVLLAEFRANLERADLLGYVASVVATSHDARPRFADGTVSALFVDGAHDYQGVLQDILDWQSSLKVDAAIAFNDPWRPGVYRALRERVLRRGSFRNPTSVQNTVFFRYQPGARWTLDDSRELLTFRSALWLRYQVNRRGWRVPRVVIDISHRAADRSPR